MLYTCDQESYSRNSNFGLSTKERETQYLIFHNCTASQVSRNCSSIFCHLSFFFHCFHAPETFVLFLKVYRDRWYTMFMNVERFVIAFSFVARTEHLRQSLSCLKRLWMRQYLANALRKRKNGKEIKKEGGKHANGRRGIAVACTVTNIS